MKYFLYKENDITLNISITKVIYVDVALSSLLSEVVYIESGSSISESNSANLLSHSTPLPPVAFSASPLPM